jgi:hypothetical protein
MYRPLGLGKDVDRHGCRNECGVHFINVNGFEAIRRRRGAAWSREKFAKDSRINR